MDRRNSGRLSPAAPRPDDWDSPVWQSPEVSYLIQTLPPRPRRQEYVHRPPRHRMRRQLNKFACFKCQLKKTKCDGARPLCGSCIKRHDVECEYPVREGAVSRYADLKVTSEELERENKDLKDLLIWLSSRPEREVLDIHRRLRTTDDPLSTLQDARDGGLLTKPSSKDCTQEHATVDTDTLGGGVLKVPARPWTSVAGDGVVSELVSAFFRWDNPFVHSFVDRELFLRDMRHADETESEFCSPFLVNSICALRSMVSHEGMSVNEPTTGDLGAQFMSEAKRHLDLEAGRLSVTTVQGLYILFLASCRDGTNGAGAMYRLAALHLLSKLQPEKELAQSPSATPQKADKHRALSTACWGLFNIECILSNMYFTPTPICPPSLPYLCDTTRNAIINKDVLGSPFGPDSAQPPIAPGILSMTNRISLLHYRVMLYNQCPRGPVGDEMDLRVRRDLYLQLTSLETSFPPHLRYGDNLTPQTIHLKTYIDLAAHAILRPLPLSTPFYPSPQLMTAKCVLLTICAHEITLLETYLSIWPLAECSPMLISGITTAVMTLLALLAEEEDKEDNVGDSTQTPDNKGKGSANNHPRSNHHTGTHDPNPTDAEDAANNTPLALFPRASTLLRQFLPRLRLVRRIMQGALAIAWKMGWTIPECARGAFKGLDTAEERAGLGDVPVEFVVPLLGGRMKRVFGGGKGGGKEGVDLAGLLGEWGAAVLESGGGESG